MARANEKFGKAYKLCSVKEIQHLFKNGSKIYKFPFSAQYEVKAQTSSTPFQIVISVPKRSFKQAVDRNRLKRLIREAVRKNKLILESFLIKENIGLTFVLIYTNKEQLSFNEINNRIPVFFNQLIQELQNDKNNT